MNFETGGAIVIGLGLLVIGVVSLMPTVEKDSTDPENGRSGMVLYTDAGTGCQYLARPIFSALTPRLDEDGKPICGVQKK